MLYEINAMVGRIPVEITQTDNTIDFLFQDGSKGHFYHDQDCCESVIVEDVCGDWKDLLNTPILVAEERISDNCPGAPSHNDRDTWTFYTFRSVKGSVDVRWHGSSNGYYSDSVNFWLKDPGDHG